MKVSIIYSKGEYVKEMAELIGEGVTDIPRVKVKIMCIDDVDELFLTKSKVIIIGGWTHRFDINKELQRWIDDRYDLWGKIGAPFCITKLSEQGAGVANMTLMRLMGLKGMAVYTGENLTPFAHIGAVCNIENIDESKELFRTYGKNITMDARRILLKAYSKDVNK